MDERTTLFSLLSNILDVVCIPLTIHELSLRVIAISFEEPGEFVERHFALAILEA